MKRLTSTLMLEGFYLGVPSIREQSLMNWFLVLFIRIKKQTKELVL